MKLLTFDEAFKPSADDITRGDGISKKKTLPLKEYPEFGRKPLSLKEEINDINMFINAQVKIFSARFAENNLNREVKKFHHIRVLGKGSISAVYLTIDENGIYYARKAFPKLKLIEFNKVNEARKEKQILDSLRFPFTMNLKYFYQDKSYIYFVLPLMAGGDLYHYLKKNKIKERLARFIAAQILLGLKYLHLIGLIYRDLKLENLLIDHYGYIKITNFGMSKLIYNKRTYTMCGTAEYMAPEVISNNGYGLAADWWSFGVLIYELCSGLTPFYAKEIIQTFSLILHNDYYMPVHFSLGLNDLVRKLLQPDLTKRLGNLRKGSDDIINHDWFKCISNNLWLAIINRRIISPIIPFISDENDNKFFKKESDDDSKLVMDYSVYGDKFENF